MITKCPVCRKEFDVLWPHLWKYKRGEKILCSWGCLRKYDERKQKNMRRNGDQMEMAGKLAEAMERGEDPLEWLKGQGYGNPKHAYQNLKAVAANDPELAEKFPKTRAYRKKAAPAEEKVTDEELARIEEEVRNLPPVKVEKLPEPDESEIWHVTAIRNKEWGEFYHDEEHGTIDWRNTYGEEVSLAVADWKRMPDLIPHILRALGVEV